jgi:hypothetical protein
LQFFLQEFGAIFGQWSVHGISCGGRRPVTYVGKK